MAYKRQHFVPVVYLRNWSTDPKRRNRRSKIWRYQIDRHTSVEVRAEIEGCEEYFYSRFAAEYAERSFHEMENDYGLISDSIISGATADSPREQLQWLLIATDLFVRNAVHSNETAAENYDAYRQRSIMFMKQLSGLEETTDMQEICDKLVEEWKIHFLRLNATPETHLITSDVPCFPLQLMGPKQHCFYMPVAPSVAIIASKNDVQVDDSRLTEKDVTFLNQAVVVNAQNALYSDTDVAAENGFGRIVDKWRTRTARLSSTWDGRTWDIVGPNYTIRPDFLG